jgi:hypothetical protein
MATNTSHRCISGDAPARGFLESGDEPDIELLESPRRRFLSAQMAGGVGQRTKTNEDE